MLKILKTVFLGTFCFVFGLFIFIGEAGADFEKSCLPVYIDNTALNTITYDAYHNNTHKENGLIWPGALVGIKPISDNYNIFEVFYSNSGALGNLSNFRCEWTDVKNSDVFCGHGLPDAFDNSFVAGMRWPENTLNKVSLYCCYDENNNLLPVGDIFTDRWEREYKSDGTMADCSLDTDGNYAEGGLSIGLRYGFNARDNDGAARCIQFASNPVDIRITEFSCGDLDRGDIACSAKIQNHGCNLFTDVVFENDKGLGSVFFKNLPDKTGDGVITIEDALNDDGGWESGAVDTGLMNKVDIDNGINGQVVDYTIRDLNEEEYDITFCARVDGSAKGGECKTIESITANKPDLIVEKLVCETCEEQGDYYFANFGASIKLGATIKNQGRLKSAPITESQRGVTFSIGEIDDNNIPHAKFSLPELSPGAPIDTFEHAFTFPDSFPSYDDKWVNYKVCVDPPGLLGGNFSGDDDGDVNESGGDSYERDSQESNCKVLRVSALMPNLRVALTGPAAVPVGSMEFLEVTVENVGYSSAPATEVDISGTGGYRCTKGVPELDKAGSDNSSFTAFCLVSLGEKREYTFSAYADSGYEVVEVSEDDNESESVTITADYPDLTVPQMQCFPGSPENPTGNAGDAITDKNFFCKAKVKNIGPAFLSGDLANGIQFFSRHSFVGTDPFYGCQRVGAAEWYCKLNGGTAKRCTSWETERTSGDLSALYPYLVTCGGQFEKEFCNYEGSSNQFYCDAVDTRTPVASYCSSDVLADSFSSDGPGYQEVTCDFSSEPMYMEEVSVCVDPASDSKPTGDIPEDNKDDDSSNCKSVSLNITLPDLVPTDLTCKYKTSSGAWADCLGGISGATDWRVPDRSDVRFAAKAKNIGDLNMLQGITRGMVYYFNDIEQMSYNLAPLATGPETQLIPQGITESIYQGPSIQGMNHVEHSDVYTIKACVDPVSNAFPLGELFEKDDSNEDNCVEKTLTIASPDLSASISCPVVISKGIPFECTASISNLTDISITDDIALGQGVVFYIDDKEIDGIEMNTGNDCRFGLTPSTVSQSCEITLSDNSPHNIKVCVDPKKNTDFGFQYEGGGDSESDSSNCDEATAMVVVPDFMLDPYSFNCPDTIVAGQDFICEVEVRNNNPGADYNLPVPIAFYINDEEVSRVNHVFTAIRKEIESGVMRVDASDVPESGVVSIKVHLDPDNDVYESNIQGHDDAENNNTYVIEGIEVVESFKPNFTIIENSIKCYDDDLLVQTGEMFACEAKVKNSGNIAPSGGFYSLFYSSWEANSFLGMDFIDTNVFSMAPGQNRTVLPVNLVLNEPGEYPIIVCADRSIAPSSNLNLKPVDGPGNITERDEDDNCLEGPTIKAVDRLMANLSIAGDESGCNLSSVAVGQEFSCSAKVRNVGHVDSPAITDGVVIYVDGEATFDDLGALSSGGGMQQFRWDNLVIEDDEGTFPRDISVEICVDPVSLEHLGGQVEEYDDGEMERNNCREFTITVMAEDTIRAEMILSSNSIRLGEGVDITISAVDAQGVTMLGVNLAFDPESPFDSYSCPIGAVSCEKTWHYTPDWSGETRAVKGYARGLSLTGEREVALPEKNLTVLPAEGGGGNMAFEVLSEATDDPIRMANVRVYETDNTLVGECGTDSTGVCGVDIDDWGEQYKLIVQGYGYDTLVVGSYIPEDLGGSVKLTPTQEEKLPVKFFVAQLDADTVKIKGATVKVFAIAAGNDIESYSSPEILSEIVEITDDNGECEFELYLSPEANKSYAATISHPNYLNSFFDFDLDSGSVGEVYQVVLEVSSGMEEITFRVMDRVIEDVIVGATVEVIGIGSRLSDSSGECAFNLIPGIDYDIRVNAGGYNDYAFDNYDASSGDKTLWLLPLEEEGPGPVTETIGAGGGIIVNEISDEITASISVPAGAFPIGVDEVEIIISPVRPTAAAAAPAMASLPDGISYIGSYIYDFSVTGNIEFNPEATISLTYTDLSVAGFNEIELDISYYNKQTGEWEQPLVNINAGTNTATVSVSNLGLFVITANKCHDLDSTQDINALGVLSYGVNRWSDTCMDDETVRQFKCNGFDFDSVVDFEDADCLGFGCTQGVCRRADDSVGLIFRVVEEGGVDVIEAAEVSAKNTVTGKEGGSCKTKADGTCTIYLPIGSEYEIMVQHGDYHDIDYGDIPNISPLDPGLTIEMTKIPSVTDVHRLKWGLSLLFVRTAQPLYWSEVTSACPDVYDQGGFFVYSPSGEQWSLAKQLDVGRAGYVLRFPGSGLHVCTVTKTGHATGFSLLISLRNGTNIFQVPDLPDLQDITLRQILGDCEVEEIDEDGMVTLMFENYRETEDEPAIRVGLDERLVPEKGYWIKVKNACVLKK